jgi:enterochelin esterase family protein
MKFHSPALFGLLGAMITLSAQSPAPATSTSTNRPPQVSTRSPEIAPDRQVTFRLRAPKAAEVTLNGQWPGGKTALVKDTNGVWSATVGPIEPGVWEYSFNVDGVGMIDPGNAAIKPMREPRTSILHLPGEPPRLHDFQEVPHGVVRFHTYRSKPLDRLRQFAVYTPPGYDQQTDAKFPTLYLQHGSGDNQATWTVHGKAHWILDNLLAQGRAKPMIVVMMDGHAATDTSREARDSNTTLFARDLLEEVMPFIEANYRVLPGASNRGLVGLSMGGGQSLTIGLNHPDRFAWVGGFSASAPSRAAVATALAQADATNDRLKLLWIACGKDDFLLQRNEEFIALLKQQNVRHEWHLTAGDHSWPIWRGYLGEFLPRLFR